MEELLKQRTMLIEEYLNALNKIGEMYHVICIREEIEKVDKLLAQLTEKLK